MNRLLNTPLFAHMQPTDIQQLITCSHGHIATLPPEEIIFQQSSTPSLIYILLNGQVAIYKTLFSGNEMLIHLLNFPGEIFGEVYVFLPHQTYDIYTMATKKTTILSIPKNFFFTSCDKSCAAHQQLTNNMLTVLAQKTYLMNQRVQVLLSGQLRNKIAYFINSLAGAGNKETIDLPPRKEMAQTLGVARPSLSRELMAMQEDKLISLKGNQCVLLDIDALEALL